MPAQLAPEAPLRDTQGKEGRPYRQAVRGVPEKDRRRGDGQDLPPLHAEDDRSGVSKVEGPRKMEEI